ncbi:MAG: 23S rRNA (uracil(1939)-C(5))-methyltransferase RlmD [Candidatus Acidiferrales bacterium]
MDITIEKLIYGGDGLAHHEGTAVFVPFVLPAERVEATAIETKKKFVRAQLDRVVQASPERVAPPCPHFGDCGGCHYQHIPYERQLEYKSDILRETLRRIGRVEWTGPIVAHGSPPWGYRNRAQWKVRPLGERDGDKKSAAPVGIGYFRANSTALCAVTECAILSPGLQRALQALRKGAGAGELPVQLREVEAFSAESAEGEDAGLLLTATFAGYPARAAELAEKIRSMVPGAASVVFHDPGRDRMELFGPGWVECEAAGEKFRVGHFSFFQVNRFLAGELAKEVIANAQGRLALDLYAGVGLFAVPLSRKFGRVVAVESNPAAGRDLETNARGAGPIEARTSDVERFLERYKEKPDLVVIDPPRDGMDQGALTRLGRIAPAEIVYVSCEPPTLARDLAVLIAAGYELSDLHLFDLFPQTFHMESVVRLRRRA